MTTQQNNPGWNGRGQLTTLVKELERQKETKIDFVADARSMVVGAVHEGDKPTAYGLAQAVARYAQDTEDGDRAADLEELAGKIIREPDLVYA